MGPIVYLAGQFLAVVMMLTVVPKVVFNIAQESTRRRKIASIIVMDLLVVAGMIAYGKYMYSTRIVAAGQIVMTVSAIAFALVLALISRAKLMNSIVYGIVLMLLTTGLAYKSIVIQADCYAGAADYNCKDSMMDMGRAIESYYCKKNAMPPKKNWQAALKPYIKDSEIFTGLHRAGGDGPNVTESRYVYTGNSLDSDPVKPLVTCHHPQYFATPARTIVLYTDLKISVIKEK